MKKVEARQQSGTMTLAAKPHSSERAYDNSVARTYQPKC